MRWRRRRELFQREISLLADLEELLRGVTIKQGKPDGWVWKAEGSGISSVKSAYKEITKVSNCRRDPFFMSLWSKKVPYKVATFGWKSALEQLPTSENLIKRGALHESS